MARTLTPIQETLLADIETPLSAYWKLAHDEPHSVLLESVTGGEQVARYSIIGLRPKGVLRSHHGQTTYSEGETTRDLTESAQGDPLAPVRDLVGHLPEGLSEGLPGFCGGAVGWISYDYVRTIERIPSTNPDLLDLPEVALMICETVVVFDHAKNQITILALSDGDPGSDDHARAEIERIKTRLREPLPALPTGTFPTHPVTATVSQAEFENGVRTIIDYILAGDCIQVVPSLRFETTVDAHPVTLYRALRSLNPSPFMYLLRLDGIDVVGASPELLVSLKEREASVRPIAGTRKRGANKAEDDALAADLLADEKERAEHIMLIDLGRNDLGRVCQPGTVRVEDLMVVERYSHVMHIVSDVKGELEPTRDGVDLVRATFPAGTLSGAPKIRAMQIIEEVEPSRRGLYGGAVGFFSTNGDVDLAIAIRTILIKDGKAYVQAGAGIVADSNPTSEYEECANKARAALRAIELAQGGL